MSATIEIRWRDKNCPMDMPVSAQEVIRSDAVVKARKHLAIDTNARYAWQCAWLLARQLRNLAAALPEGTLQLHTTNQITAPRPYDVINGLSLEIRYVIGNKIQWDIGLHAAHSTWESRQRYTWTCVSDPHVYRSSKAVNALVRELDRVARPAFVDDCRKLAAAWKAA